MKGAGCDQPTKNERTTELKSETILDLRCLQVFVLYFQTGVNTLGGVVLIGFPNKNNHGLQFFVKFTGFGPYYDSIILADWFAPSG